MCSSDLRWTGRRWPVDQTLAGPLPHAECAVVESGPLIEPLNNCPLGERARLRLVDPEGGRVPGEFHVGLVPGVQAAFVVALAGAASDVAAVPCLAPATAQGELPPVVGVHRLLLECLTEVDDVDLGYPFAAVNCAARPPKIGRAHV